MPLIRAKRWALRHSQFFRDKIGSIAPVKIDLDIPEEQQAESKDKP